MGLEVPAMRHLRQIGDLLSAYYHDMPGRLDLARERQKATGEHIAELERFLQSDALIPTRGVARYEQDGGSSGSPSDSTYSAVLQYEHNAEEFQREIARLKRRLQALRDEEYELRDSMLVIGRAIALLAADLREMVEERYRDRMGLMKMAIQRGYSEESTVRFHLDKALQSVARCLQSSSQLFAVQITAETFQKNSRRCAENSRQTVLSYG
jgi:predicted RNase H-like nuclease (RuvC/YqgF family)